MADAERTRDWRLDGVRVVRSGQAPVVVNLDLPDVEPDPQPVRWVDDLHD